MGKSEAGKTEVVYCRVNETLKKRLEDEVKERGGEAEAVIVREALREYFDRRDHPEKYPPTQQGQHFQINERSEKSPTPAAPEDIAARKLGQRSGGDITGSPAATPEPEGQRIRHKVVGTIRRAAEEKSGRSEKREK